MPAEAYEPLECPNCNGGAAAAARAAAPTANACPNGQIPDDWMWGCGGWPYANGPGTCDDWKVGPIWDVTVDGMVMTREANGSRSLRKLRCSRSPRGDPDPEVTEQFDRGPGGRVYLTGLVPRNVGYQVMAGYEGIEEWNAAIVFPEAAAVSAVRRTDDATKPVLSLEPAFGRTEHHADVQSGACGRIAACATSSSTMRFGIRACRK